MQKERFQWGRETEMYSPPAKVCSITAAVVDGRIGVDHVDTGVLPAVQKSDIHPDTERNDPYMSISGISGQ